MNNPTSLNVLQVLPGLNHGGVERATVDMAHGLCERYGRTFIASSGGALKALLPPTCVHMTLPLARKNPWIMIKNACALMRIIKEHNIHILHVRSRAPGWSAWLARKWTRVPLVTTYHGVYKAQGFLKKFYNSVMARGDGVIAISQFLNAHIKREYPWAKSILIYEGIDTDFFAPKDCAPSDSLPKTPLLFAPSRQSPIKGIETLLFALKNMRTPCEILLIEAGKHSAITRIKKLIDDLCLTNYVRWIPATDDLRPFYALCDIVIVPSRVPEALGRVNIEALAMEKLLIASDLGANTESCIEGKTGMLFHAGNAKNLAQKIERMLHLGEKEKDTLRTNGRALILSQFPHTTMIAQTMALYERLNKKSLE